jgi:hypothetical protein
MVNSSSDQAEKLNNFTAWVLPGQKPIRGDRVRFVSAVKIS